LFESLALQSRFAFAVELSVSNPSAQKSRVSVS